MKTISRLLEDLFIVDAVYESGNILNLSLRYRYEKTKSQKILKDRLKLGGYKYTLEENDQHLLLLIDPKATFKIPRINIVLFIITLCSVYLVPVFLKQLYIVDIEPATRALHLENIDNLTTWQFLQLLFHSFPLFLKSTFIALGQGAGIEFTLAMISILFVHEMGHYIASRRRDIITSWPYFIPAPNIIGTFGAVIKSKSPFWNRRDLIEVGAAGPIAGWVIAILWLWYGLSQSNIVPQEAIVGFEGFSLEGESLLMKLLTINIIGEAPSGYYYKLTEAAFAGWVGLLVTSINMLPIGQLDGGHILYGLLRKRQLPLGVLAMGILIILGFTSPMWWFFAIFGLVFGVKHPPTLNDNKNPGKYAYIMGVVAIIILIISFTPIPFQQQ